MPRLVLRFDMRNPEFGAPTDELYRAAIEMCAWGEDNGFEVVQISEHHASDDGYLPSPIALAAAIAARTRRIRIRFSLILTPFNHPLKIAEDLAVVDVISGGRTEVVLGAGYVPAEFEMFGVDPVDRGRIMEETIGTLEAAFTGEPFTFRGRPALVRPRPAQRPRPPLWMGGSTRAAARRAARLADDFYTGSRELYDVFRAAVLDLGRQDPGPWKDIGTGFVVATDDPEREWQRMAPYILHETNSYGRWQRSGGTGGQYVAMNDVEPLKSTGLYPILTPADAIEYARERGPQGAVCLHPLISGQSPAAGWAQLHYFAEHVLPTVLQPDFHR